MLARFLLSFVLSSVALGVYSSPAKACGGFFCDNSQPVDQAAERIIFSQNPDGTTTAAIQILYSGPSERFAWMLPVVGSPEISVSSNIAFQRLQRQTDPQYLLDVRVEGQCRQREYPDAGWGGHDAAPSDGGPAFDAGPPPVTVVNAGSVGPYDFVVISVDPDAEDIATVATEWLNENSYDVSEFGRDRLVPYLESGMNLLAFRLTKGRSAGEIRPVVLNFGAGLPSIPLRPTAAAATPDMGILVYVLGASRATPANYLDLELNEARIAWSEGAYNYNDVVTLAANEAGGQGFVTEFSGDAPPLGEVIFSPAEDADWAALVASTASDFSKLGDTARRFRGWDGLLEAFLAELTKPEAASEDEWARDPLNTLINYVPSVRETQSIEGFDFASFAERIEAEVLGPVRETAALFAGVQKLTRMYTTMSPEEMTMDPVFHFNAELPDYSNIHRATQVVECASNVYRADAPWHVMFAGGITVRGRGFGWPLANSETLPAVKITRRVGTSGEGNVVLNNAALIASVVNSNNSAYPPGSMPGADGGPTSDAGGGGDAGGGAGGAAGGGCGITQSKGPSGLFLALGFVLLWRRRR